MKTAGEWRRHLRDLMNASLDPVVYAVRWAQDPRLMQRATGHCRVGSPGNVVTPRGSPCRLWSFDPK
jgi:hypothetical protein